MEKKTSQDRRRVHYEVQTRRDYETNKEIHSILKTSRTSNGNTGLDSDRHYIHLLPFVRPEIKKDIGISGLLLRLPLLGHF